MADRLKECDKVQAVHTETMKIQDAVVVETYYGSQWNPTVLLEFPDSKRMWIAVDELKRTTRIARMGFFKGEKFQALHPNTMNPEWATITDGYEDPKRGNVIRLDFEDGANITNTPHHFRRFLKLAEHGVFDRLNYTQPKE